MHGYTCACACIRVHTRASGCSTTCLYEGKYTMECVLVPLRCVGGPLDYVRGYFHCVPLLRSETGGIFFLLRSPHIKRHCAQTIAASHCEAQFWPISQSERERERERTLAKPFYNASLGSISILTFISWALLLENLFFYVVWYAWLTHDWPACNDRNHIFHQRKLFFWQRPHLGFVACTRHPALEEAEGATHFVLLRLCLGGDYVLIPLLILDPVWNREHLQSTALHSTSRHISFLRHAASPAKHEHTFITTITLLLS